MGVFIILAPIRLFDWKCIYLTFFENFIQKYVVFIIRYEMNSLSKYSSWVYNQKPDPCPNHNPRSKEKFW